MRTGRSGVRVSHIKLEFSGFNAFSTSPRKTTFNGHFNAYNTVYIIVLLVFSLMLFFSGITSYLSLSG